MNKIQKKRIEDVASIFNLGKVNEIRKTKYGVSNQNYILSTDSTKYHLKILEGENKLLKLSKIIEISKACKRKKINELLLPLKYHVENNRVLVLFPYVSGIHKEELTEEEIKSLSKILYEFHSLSNYIYDKKIFIHKNEKRLDYKLLFSKNTNKLNLIKKLMNKEKAEKIDKILNKAINHRINNVEIIFQEALLHGDIDFTNYFFSDGKIISFFDYENAYLGSREEEIIKTIINLCIYRNLSKPFLNKTALSFLKNYKNLYPEMSFKYYDIDFIVYRYILDSLSAFLPKSKTNNISFKISNIMFNKLLIYEKNKEIIRDMLLSI